MNLGMLLQILLSKSFKRSGGLRVAFRLSRIDSAGNEAPQPNGFFSGLIGRKDPMRPNGVALLTELSAPHAVLQDVGFMTSRGDFQTKTGNRRIMHDNIFGPRKQTVDFGFRERSFHIWLPVWLSPSIHTASTKKETRGIERNSLEQIYPINASVCDLQGIVRKVKECSINRFWIWLPRFDPWSPSQKIHSLDLSR